MNMGSYGIDTTGIPQSLEQPYYHQPPKLQRQKRFTRRKPTRMYHQNPLGEQIQEADSLSDTSRNDGDKIGNTIVFPAFTFSNPSIASPNPHDVSPTHAKLIHTTPETTPETVVSFGTYTQTSSE